MTVSKFVLCFFVGYLTMTATSLRAESRAVEININGIGSAVDNAALATVRQVFGSAVANGVVDKFMVNGYGKEGGFSACAEASAQTKSFATFVRQLRTITPNLKTTAYSLTARGSCTEEIAVCTMDVKSCADGSFVSRVPPTCEFAACPGN